MKIALVARHVSAPATASDLYAAEQADHVAGLGKALAAQRHNVVIYARKVAPGMPDRETLAPGLTARYIKAGPPAPVPADQLPQHVAEIARYLAARGQPVPVIQSFGSLGTAEARYGVPGPGASARIRMEACIARTVTGVLAAASDEVTELSGLGIPGARVRVVPCGVDTSRFDPEGPAAKRNGEFRLLHVGSLAEHSGLGTLLKALAGLPGAELVIAGGPDQDELDSDIACKKLGKLAAALGVGDRGRRAC